MTLCFTMTAGEVVYLPQLEGNRLGRGLLYVLGAYGKKQQLRNGASVLYQGITEAAEDAELQQGVLGFGRVEAGCGQRLCKPLWVAPHSALKAVAMRPQQCLSCINCPWILC